MIKKKLNPFIIGLAKKKSNMPIWLLFNYSLQSSKKLSFSDLINNVTSKGVYLWQV